MCDASDTRKLTPRRVSVCRIVAVLDQLGFLEPFAALSQSFRAYSIERQKSRNRRGKLLSSAAVTSISVIPIPDDLRGALAERSMSQNDLSAATNIDPGTISRYCNGLRPTLRNAAKIAEALGLVVDGPVSS